MLERIHVEQFTEDDLRRLIRLCKVGYEGISAGDVLRSVALGGLAAYRFMDSGLVIFEIVAYRGGRELLVWGLVGSGFIKVAKELAEEFERIARSQGCRWIGGRAFRPGLARIYERLGFPAIATYHLKEIK